MNSRLTTRDCGFGGLVGVLGALLGVGEVVGERVCAIKHQGMWFGLSGGSFGT